MFIFSIIAGLIKFDRPLRDYDSSFTQPYFVFFYKDRREESHLNDIWNKFKDKYQDDESVTLTEINCDGKQAGLCNLQLQTNRFPIIAAVRRAVVFPLDNIYTEDDLENEYKNEENYNRERLCRLFPSEIFTYPYVIYNTTKDYVEACNEAIEAAPDVENAHKYIYIQKAKEESLYVKTGYSSFTIKDGPTKENLKYCISEFRYMQLQELELAQALQSQRRVAIFITNYVDDIVKYEVDASTNSETTLVTRITSTDFNQELGNIHYVNDTTELPALVLFNEDKDKWMVIPKINDEKLNMSKVFADQANGDYDDQMHFDIEVKELINYKKKYTKIIYIMSIVIVVSFVAVILKSLICHKHQASQQNKIE